MLERIYPQNLSLLSWDYTCSPWFAFQSKAHPLVPHFLESVPPGGLYSRESFEFIELVVITGF